MPHGEGVKAKNEKRRTRACIYAREPQSSSPAETAIQLLLAEPTNRATSCTFLSAHESLDGTLPKGSPRCRQLARVFRAHTHTAPKKELQPSSGARRGEQKRQKAEDATRTQRHAPALRCRRRIVPKRSLRTTGKEGMREESGRTKNPSQLEVVRDWRRVTDGIRTHDIQNHNLTL